MLPSDKTFTNLVKTSCRMVSSLENCSPEIIECIVVLLSLRDIRRLRLSCKSLAWKCSQHHFKSFFLLKHVELTDNALQAFADGIKAGGLPCLLQDLVLIGIANEKHNGPDYAPKDPSLLCQAFKGLATNEKIGKLRSLSLRVEVDCENRGKQVPCTVIADFLWERVWKSAADTFQLTFRALAESGLPIESLDIFNGIRQQQCSLASDHFDKINWTEPGLATSLAHVRSLSISLSNRALKFYEDRDEDHAKDEETSEDEDEDETDASDPPEREESVIRAEAEDEGNFKGLPKLFQLLTQLQSFELHYLHIHSFSELNLRHEKLLQCLAESETLPKLHSCSLCGISAREEDLLMFITRTSVRDLSLKTVRLRSGSFRSIFDFCISEKANMTRLYFDALYEAERGMAHFVGPGRSAIGYDPLTTGSEMLERQGDEIKRHITYHFPPPRPMGNPRLSRWRGQQRLLYTATM